MLIQSSLFFGGRCEGAIVLYRPMLGAQVERLMRHQDSPERCRRLAWCLLSPNP